MGLLFLPSQKGGRLIRPRHCTEKVCSQCRSLYIHDSGCREKHAHGGIRSCNLTNMQVEFPLDHFNVQPATAFHSLVFVAVLQSENCI